MKTERNILIAFILNLSFSIFEFFGGIFTGSTAIISDAVHDAGDAIGIGISYFLEKLSKKQPNETYTYGYARYSVLSGFIMSLILLLGAVLMIVHALVKLYSPKEIHYGGMIVFAIVGVCVNLCAALFTRRGHSLNQRAVNLHLLEDVLGWVVVLFGAVVMHFTNLSLLDPIMSLGVSLFILLSAVKTLKEAACLFLEAAPQGISASDIKSELITIDGVLEAHHLHLWSIDGQSNCATVHIVTDAAPQTIKAAVRQRLHAQGIGHVTVEIETADEDCRERHCAPMPVSSLEHHHH